MDNKKLKKIIIILLVVLLLAFGGLYLYRKFVVLKGIERTNVPIQHGVVDTNKQEEKVEETTKDVATTFYENMVKNRKLSEDYNHNINIVMDKDGSVYYSGDIDKAIGEKREYTIEGYSAGIDENGKMSNVLNGYKLNISNVVMFFYGETGNGGWRDYIFVKSDGTIGKLIYDVNTLTKKVSIVKFEETVSGYKNIIGIQVANSWDAHGYRLIDINGNIF